MDLKRTKGIHQFSENVKPKPISKNPIRLMPDYTRKRVDYEESIVNPSSELERQYYVMETASGSSCDATLAGLSKLQEFRLNHANDCFSVYRQMDLKMDKVLPSKKQDKVLPSKKQSTVMPYAMRQRLLRFQLEADDAEAVDNARRRKVQQGV